MVLTVETVLYCPVDYVNAPSVFRGIRMRVEENVALGDAHGKAEVLSAAAVKEIEDIEELVGSRMK